MPAGPPSPDTHVPAMLMEFAHGRPYELVWRNELGGLTIRILDANGTSYAKWQLGTASLDAEFERLQWLANRHPAPTALELITDARAAILVTCGVPAHSAVDERWRLRPATALAAIGDGLRRLHALPLDDCPYRWTVAARLSRCSQASREALGTPPPIDRLVVCHGDACAPNTLVNDDGDFAATLDVGALGIADRWADLAAATLSFGWNYGDIDHSPFWRAYGVEPDEQRLDWYRRLWLAG